MVQQISVSELSAVAIATANSENAPIVLDVREPWEVNTARIPASLHIPMGQITSRYQELDPERSIVCLCHHGVRSMQVAMFLQSRGFVDVSNLSGGIDAWSREIDTGIPIY